MNHGDGPLYGMLTIFGLQTCMILLQSKEMNASHKLEAGVCLLPVPNLSSGNTPVASPGADVSARLEA